MSWPVYDAKARFSEFLETTLTEGPQVVTRRGVEAAVLVSIEEWNHVKQQARQIAPDPLMDPNAPHDIPVPAKRPALQMRPFPFDDNESR